MYPYFNPKTPPLLRGESLRPHLHLCAARCYTIAVIDWNAVPSDVTDIVLQTLPPLLSRSIRPLVRPSTDGLPAEDARMCPCQPPDGQGWALGCHPTSGWGSSCSIFTRNEDKWHKKFLTISVGDAMQEAEGDRCMDVINTLAVVGLGLLSSTSS